MEHNWWYQYFHLIDVESEACRQLTPEARPRRMRTSIVVRFDKFLIITSDAVKMSGLRYIRGTKTHGKFLHGNTKEDPLISVWISIDLWISVLNCPNTWISMSGFVYKDIRAAVVSIS